MGNEKTTKHNLTNTKRSNQDEKSGTDMELHLNYYRNTKATKNKDNKTIQEAKKKMQKRKAPGNIAIKQSKKDERRGKDPDEQKEKFSKMKVA